MSVLLVAGALICGWQAIRSPRLLAAAVWLAGVSVLVAIGLYHVGAHETAVIELSVGAGLVTVLFVFAIVMAGEDAMAAPAVVPRWLAWALAVAGVALLAWLTLPLGGSTTAGFTAEGAGGAEVSPLSSALSAFSAVSSDAATTSESTFAVVLWQERALDMLVQIGLIFAAVLGVLGLLAEPATAARLESRSDWRVRAVRGPPLQERKNGQAGRWPAPVEIREPEEAGV